MSQIEWVVFDLGEVLVKLDTPLMYSEIARVGGCDPKYLEDLLEGQVDEFVKGQISTEAFYQKLLKGLPVKPAYPEFCEALCKQLQDPVEGMEELLKELTPQIKIACLSNTNDEHWKYCHRTYSLMQYLQVELTSHDLHARKPDLEIYRKAEKILNAEPSALLFLDDTPENVEGARRAGWNVFQFKGYDDCVEQLRRYGVYK